VVNFAAVAVEFGPNDLREIEAANFTVQGARYPEDLLKQPAANGGA
jgi:hypothetical protein